MLPRGDDNAWVAQYILNILRYCPVPLSRDNLTDRVSDHAWNGLGILWQRSTAARRVREALECLLDGDCPVISAGGGFKLASRATAAERDRAAQLAERQAVRLFAKARKIRAVALPGDPRDGELFPEVSV